MGDKAKFEATWEFRQSPRSSELRRHAVFPGRPPRPTPLLLFRPAEDLAQLQDRSDEIARVFKPYNGWHTWKRQTCAVITMRIDHTERMERRIREKIRLRAMLTWDSDRCLEAVMQGEGLATKPAQPSKSSEETPQGCDWLIKRWALLAYAPITKITSGQPSKRPWSSTCWPLPPRSALAASPALRSTITAGVSIRPTIPRVARRAVDELLKHREPWQSSTSEAGSGRADMDPPRQRGAEVGEAVMSQRCTRDCAGRSSRWSTSRTTARATPSTPPIWRSRPPPRSRAENR